MAEHEESNKPDEMLKPFYERASDAEVRLAKLESLLSKKDEAETDNAAVTSIVKDFQSKLHIAQAELVAEREKASTTIQKLEAENNKLQYRVTHLIRALREADAKLKDLTS